jgi:hypothetical protein
MKHHPTTKEGSTMKCITTTRSRILFIAFGYVAIAAMLFV